MNARKNPREMLENFHLTYKFIVTIHECFNIFSIFFNLDITDILLIYESMKLI